ncbi:MAG: hypothetical protein M3Z16_05925 [Pseudomonadota bacterium]|nr:hypothetical protein [Pseudomonadota bacterium]
MSVGGLAAAPHCPACGFEIFNRRYPRCESCGAALPDSLVYSEAERETLRSVEAARDLREARDGRVIGNDAVPAAADPLLTSLIDVTDR